MVALAICAFDCSSHLLWVGSTELEVEFVVVDADTGAPVEGAEIVVRTGGGWYAGADEEREVGGFTLRSDVNGCARRVCQSNMVAGEESGLGFTSIRSVYMPRLVIPCIGPWVSHDRACHIGPARVPGRPSGGWDAEPTSWRSAFDSTHSGPNTALHRTRLLHFVDILVCGPCSVLVSRPDR